MPSTFRIAIAIGFQKARGIVAVQLSIRTLPFFGVIRFVKKASESDVATPVAVAPVEYFSKSDLREVYSKGVLYGQASMVLARKPEGHELEYWQMIRDDNQMFDYDLGKP